MTTQDLSTNPAADIVRSLSMYGVPEDHIATRLRLSVSELRRRYGHELRTGKSDGVITALSTLYTLAVGRDADPENGIRAIHPDEKCLRFYLQTVAGMNTSNDKPKAPKNVGEEAAVQILKTIVGTPQEMMEFLRMRRDLRMAEDAEDGIIIENGEVDF